MSHLTRGAWIEMSNKRITGSSAYGRTSHEVRGLKFCTRVPRIVENVVAPHTRCVD